MRAKSSLRVGQGAALRASGSAMIGTLPVAGRRPPMNNGPPATCGPGIRGDHFAVA